MPFLFSGFVGSFVLKVNNQGHLKYLLIAIGTRGDVEPFLAIGQELHARGHEAICVFPEQFRSLAEDTHLPFVGLKRAFLELIMGKDGKAVMGGKVSFFQKILAYRRLYTQSLSINRILLKEQYEIAEKELPDRILYSGKALYGPIWGSANKGKAHLLSPIPCLIHPTKEFPHVGFNGNYGGFINKLSYKLANWGLLQNIKSSSKFYRKELGIGMKDIKQQLFKSDMLYAVSPNLFEKPKDLPIYAHFVGYHERNRQMNWKPDPDLLEFMERHEKVLFITFGSMMNPEPRKNSDLLLGILDLLKIPTVVNVYGGGLQKSDRVNVEQFHFVERVPYEWMFPKVYATIHHGGSGTTHMAAKYGCAQMIIPHIIDQFLWNEVVARKGLGPKGRSIRKINKAWLKSSIMDLWQNADYKGKAQNLGNDMRAEDLMPEYLGILES